MRNQILKAAAEEMMTRGVKFTMSNLASRLSISKTSLYEHFASKNELIYHVLAIAIADIKSQDEEIYANSSLTLTGKIHALLKVAPKSFGPISNRHIYDDLCHYYPEEFKLVQEFRGQQIDRLSELIARGIELRVIRPVNIKVLRQIVRSATQELFSYSFLSENNMTFPDALAAMSDILVLGLKNSHEKEQGHV